MNWVRSNKKSGKLSEKELLKKQKDFFAQRRLENEKERLSQQGNREKNSSTTTSGSNGPGQDLAILRSIIENQKNDSRDTHTSAVQEGRLRMMDNVNLDRLRFGPGSSVTPAVRYVDMDGTISSNRSNHRPPPLLNRSVMSAIGQQSINRLSTTKTSLFAQNRQIGSLALIRMTTPNFKYISTGGIISSKTVTKNDHEPADTARVSLTSNNYTNHGLYMNAGVIGSQSAVLSGPSSLTLNYSHKAVRPSNSNAHFGSLTMMPFNYFARNECRLTTMPINSYAGTGSSTMPFSASPRIEFPMMPFNSSSRFELTTMPVHRSTRVEPATEKSIMETIKGTASAHENGTNISNLFRSASDYRCQSSVPLASTPHAIPNALLECTVAPDVSASTSRSVGQLVPSIRMDSPCDTPYCSAPLRPTANNGFTRIRHQQHQFLGGARAEFPCRDICQQGSSSTISHDQFGNFKSFQMVTKSHTDDRMLEDTEASEPQLFGTVSDLFPAPDPNRTNFCFDPQRKTWVESDFIETIERSRTTLKFENGSVALSQSTRTVSRAAVGIAVERSKECADQHLYYPGNEAKTFRENDIGKQKHCFDVARQSENRNVVLQRDTDFIYVNPVSQECRVGIHHSYVNSLRPNETQANDGRGIDGSYFGGNSRADAQIGKAVEQIGRRVLEESRQIRWDVEDPLLDFESGCSSVCSIDSSMTSNGIDKAACTAISNSRKLLNNEEQEVDDEGDLFDDEIIPETPVRRGRHSVVALRTHQRPARLPRTTSVLPSSPFHSTTGTIKPQTVPVWDSEAVLLVSSDSSTHILNPVADISLSASHTSAACNTFHSSQTEHRPQIAQLPIAAENISGKCYAKLPGIHMAIRPTPPNLSRDYSKMASTLTSPQLVVRSTVEENFNIENDLPKEILIQDMPGSDCVKNLKDSISSISRFRDLNNSVTGMKGNDMSKTFLQSFQGISSSEIVPQELTSTESAMNGVEGGQISKQSFKDIHSVKQCPDHAEPSIFELTGSDSTLSLMTDSEMCALGKKSSNDYFVECVSKNNRVGDYQNILIDVGELLSEIVNSAASDVQLSALAKVKQPASPHRAVVGVLNHSAKNSHLMCSHVDDHEMLHVEELEVTAESNKEHSKHAENIKASPLVSKQTASTHTAVFIASTAIGSIQTLPLNSIRLIPQTSPLICTVARSQTSNLISTTTGSLQTSSAISLTTSSVKTIALSSKETTSVKIIPFIRTAAESVLTSTRYVQTSPAVSTETRSMQTSPMIVTDAKLSVLAPRTQSVQTSPLVTPCELLPSDNRIVLKEKNNLEE